MVQEVVVSPQMKDWFVEMVREVIQAFRLSAPVSRSTLLEAPDFSTVAQSETNAPDAAL